MAKNYIERQNIEPWTSKKTIISFWIRRFFRIAPLYYILLIFAFSYGENFGYYRDIIATVWPTTQTETARYTDSSIQNILMHITFLFGLSPHYSFRTVLPDWSIGLEMQYYALLPFIMLLTKRIGFILLSVLLFFICILSTYIFNDYFSTFQMPSMILFKLPLFLSGMLIYKASSEDRTAYILTAMIAPLTTILMSFSISKIQFIINESLIVGMSILMMEHKIKPLQLISHTTKKFLSLKFSQFLGDVSYSVYLIHLMIVIPVIGYLIQSTGIAEQSSLIRFTISAILTLPVTYIISWLSFNFIERQGILIGRKLVANKTSSR